MNIALIPCEYNPFHNGHKYLINTLKKENNITHIIAAMSGAVTQRGECAVFDKKIRAACAINSGADLVISLPFVYSAQNAQTFAIGAVFSAMLTSSSYIAFGCDENDLSLYDEALAICSSEAFCERMKNAKSSNKPYPQMRIDTLNELSNTDFSFLRESNNILAFEYIKALKEKCDGSIKPIALKRCGVLHSDMEPKGNIASASYIRSLIKNENFSEALKYIPDECEMNASFIKNNYLSQTKELAVIAKSFIMLLSNQQLSKICDMQNGMESLFTSNLKALNLGIDNFAREVSGKRISLSRVRRCLFDMLLSYTKEDNENIKNAPPSFIRILAANDKGRQLINKIKKNDKLCVITKLADGYRSLSERDRHIIDFDIKSEDLVNMEKASLLSDFKFTPYIK